MPDIVHQTTIRAPLQRVSHAVTDPDAIAQWWTREVTDHPETQEIEFRFPGTGIVAHVRHPSLVHVEWSFTRAITDDMAEWIGTTVTITLSDAGNGATTVHFVHRNWRAESEYFATCNYVWALVLTSLREYAEHGTGTPFPELMSRR